MAFISHLALPARTSLAPVCLPSCARRPRGSRCAAAPSASLSAPAAAGVAALAAAAALAVLPADAKALSFAAPRPAGLGVRSERYLASCPAGAKNCIGSLDDVYSKTYVPNWTYAQPLPDEKRTAKSMDQAVTDLLQVLGNYEGEKVEVVVNRPTKSDVGTGRYVYAEFATKTFGFVDDVEFVSIRGRNARSEFDLLP